MGLCLLVVALLAVANLVQAQDKLGESSRLVCTAKAMNEYEQQNPSSILTTQRHVLELAQPPSNFHSHSWWHMAEYYLSRRQLKLGLDIPEDGILSVVAFSEEFVDVVNPMAMLLLLASFTSGKVKRVELYKPQKLTKTANGNVLFRAHGEYMYVYDPSLPAKEQFFYMDVHRECVYGHFMGTVGEVPIDRGKFFPEGPQLLRDTLSKACENHLGYSIFDTPAPVTLNKRGQALRGPGAGGDVDKREGERATHKLLVFQRNLDRFLVAADTAAEKLRRALEWDVRLILHHESEHPCTIYHDFNRADVVLTVHGYQAVGAVFMREGAQIVEIFNYRYFKSTYILLAGEMRVNHEWFQDDVPTSISRMPLMAVTQDMCMGNGWCRDFARKDDVVLTDEVFNKVLTRIRSGEHHPTDSPRAVGSGTGTGSAGLPMPGRRQ